MFSGAYLVAVPYNSSNENATVGKFHLVDGGQLAFHASCSHIVTTVDSLPRAEVSVMWKSSVRLNMCVEFRYHLLLYSLNCNLAVKVMLYELVSGTNLINHEYHMVDCT